MKQNFDLNLDRLDKMKDQSTNGKKLVFHMLFDIETSLYKSNFKI